MKFLVYTLLFCFTLAIPAVNQASIYSSIASLKHQADTINPQALRMAVLAYAKLKSKSKYLAIVDFSKPSNQPRFFIFNMQTMQIVQIVHVAHGTNSGGLYATSFSNKVNSHQSSLGVFQTTVTYYGKHGYSLKLQGLDSQFNSNAESRAIVIHGASYAEPSFIKKHGKAGRSWGCFAVPMSKSTGIIDLLKHGSLVFAYAPNPAFLKDAKYVNS